MKIAMTSANQPIVLNEDGTWQYLKPSGSCLEKMRKLEQPESVVKFFSELFDRLGIKIIDSTEKLICIHHGDRIEFEDGIDEESVDFCVSLYSFQIDRFIADVNAGYSDPLAHFRLVREFFRMPSHDEKSLLHNSLLDNSTFRKLIHSKNLLHVHLISPDKSAEDDATFTLFFVNGSWNLTHGLVGEPERIFRLSADDALELNRRIFSASQEKKITALPELAKWYINWRERVEVKAA